MCCRNCTRLHDPVCRARSETRKAVRYLKSPQAGGAKEREPKCTFIQSPGSLTQRPYMSVIPSERCGFSSPFAPAADRKHVRLYLFSKSGELPEKPQKKKLLGIVNISLLRRLARHCCGGCWRTGWTFIESHSDPTSQNLTSQSDPSQSCRNIPGVGERHVLRVPLSTPELLHLRILREYSERSGTLR